MLIPIAEREKSGSGRPKKKERTRALDQDQVERKKEGIERKVYWKQKHRRENKTARD